MKKHILRSLTVVSAALLIGLGSCNKDTQQINYEYGTFPEEVMALEGLNSEYDDFNATIPLIRGGLPIMFSTNRESQGGDFDIITGYINFYFNQIYGDFSLESVLYTDSFFSNLQDKVNSPTDQFGPYRFFNSRNGMEYFFVASETVSGDLDLQFIEYTPPNLGEPPFLTDPISITRLNSSSDDAYISIDWDIENVYLTSDRSGDFDIYTLPIDNPSTLNAWLTDVPATLLVADSVNSISDDKCPYIFDDIMIFTSDRAGGLGGFDLYYSKFVDGKWGSPVNFGPNINTQYNEYRPLLGFASGYTNNFMIFSSDRPEGAGGYDLYFVGVTIE
jgi:hypothetical protein